MKGLGRRIREPRAISDSLEKEPEMKKDIRILLVDDHEHVRHRLRRMLETEEDMEVVGDCANAEEAFSKMARLHPDIVLMGTRMPGINGVETTRHLERNGLDYDGDVIMLAESKDYQVEALEAGAASYLLKDITHAELTQAIREVYWSKQLPGYGEGLVEEAVELVVPPPAKAARLLRFMCQLEEGLHDRHDNYANIMHTVGSWDWGAVITILLKPTRVSSFLDKLGYMPDVEKVDEEPLAGGASSSLPKKTGVLPRPSISPSKRFRVTLKEAGKARQRLATVLS